MIGMYRGERRGMGVGTSSRLLVFVSRHYPAVSPGSPDWPTLIGPPGLARPDWPAPVRLRDFVRGGVSAFMRDGVSEQLHRDKGRRLEALPGEFLTGPIKAVDSSSQERC